MKLTDYKFSIKEDDSKLIIDVNVDNGLESIPLYVYVIQVNSQNTYGQPTNLYETLNIISSQSNIHLELTDTQLNGIVGNLFFINVSVYDMAEHLLFEVDDVIYNTVKIAKQNLNYIKEINESELVPKYLIDSILKEEALKTAIRSKIYSTAIGYWNKFCAND